MSDVSTVVSTTRSRPTLYDVCRKSGVSSATVSRVMTGSARVSEEIGRRVREAIAELGYEPSHSARALAGKRTSVLGVLFPEIASGFYSHVLAGIDEVAAESEFDVLTAFFGKRRNKPDLMKRLLSQGRVDALLLMNTELDTQLIPTPMLKEWPIILIDRPMEGTGLPAITMDNQGATEQMIEHLFEQGHRRIAVVTGPVGTYDSEQRLMGCRSAMSRLGLDLPAELLWQGDFRTEGGELAMRRFLKTGLALPDAIFCLNDGMAIGVLNVLRDQGLSVPENIALAGFDDVDAAAHLSLTSVACPMRLMGQMAARAAIQVASRSGTPVSNQCLRARLVIRRSSQNKRD